MTPSVERAFDLPPGCSTLVDVLRWRAAHQPDEVAFRFLLDGESREAVLTYRELGRRAGALATALQMVRGRGERALLLYPPGMELICAWYGCLLAGMVAVAVQPPSPRRLSRFRSRIAGVVDGCAPTVVLTTAALRTWLSEALPRIGGLTADRWLATDTDENADVCATGQLTLGPDDLAFLQYTSGSTSAPRGVMVSHGNLMHNLGAIQRSFGLSSRTGIVSWLPPYHDMGLIGGILAPIHLGTPATLMAPVAFVQRPRRWLQAISRSGAAASGGPNFAFDLCVRKVTPEQRAALDLSGWRVAFNGAEPIESATLRRFAEYFAPCGFRPEAIHPCYGLAEATLLVSAKPPRASPRVESFARADLERDRITPCSADAPGARTVVACGAPVAQVAIVDPASATACLPDRVGEIWVAGASVTRGYWNDNAATECTFRALLGDTGGGPFLRTGDLGFLRDGELFVTGRLKDLVIIDGINHYPQDIERAAGSSHEALESMHCAAFSVDVTGREELVLVAAVRSAARTDAGDLQRAVRTAVSEQHDLHVRDLVLVKPGGVPKTTSGKIRRHACRTAYLAGTLDTWAEESR